MIPSPSLRRLLAARPAARVLALCAAGLFFTGAAVAQDAGTSPPSPAVQSPTAAPSVASPEPAAPESSTPEAEVPAPETAAPPQEPDAAGSTAQAPVAAAPDPAGQTVSTSAGPAAPAPAIAAALPHDLSPWGMFMAADYVVKGVMIGLAFASLVTWTIWLAKALELAFARARAARAVRRLERADSLAEVASGAKNGKWPKRGPVAALVAAAEIEIERSGQLSAEGVKERTQVALQRIEARAGRSMARGTGLLATIGSTAPFVGLFGTVWGIMNSFIGISQANTTNLAVVAPGIAEALLATAIGLVAAIPAVIIYNVFARSIAGYRAILADASAEVLRHLSRDLDRRTLYARSQTVVGARLQAAE